MKNGNNGGGYTADYVPSTHSAYYKRAVTVLNLCRVKCCHGCGSTDKLEAHHIDEDITNNDVLNLMWLCRSCHEDLHDIRQKN